MRERGNEGVSMKVKEGVSEGVSKRVNVRELCECES